MYEVYHLVLAKLSSISTIRMSKHFQPSTTMLVCIQFTVPILNKELRTALFEAAESLLLEKRRRTNISGKDFKGFVRTDWDAARFAAHYGTRFHAVTDSGKQKPNEIEFMIISPHDRALGIPPKKISDN
jgi:hypothetical protein